MSSRAQAGADPDMTVITRTAIPANVPSRRWTRVNVWRRLQQLSWTIKNSPLLAPRQVGCNGDIAVGPRCQTIASAPITTQFIFASKRQTSLTMESHLTIISTSKQHH
jgi:hypothetical protein